MTAYYSSASSSGIYSRGGRMRPALFVIGLLLGLSRMAFANLRERTHGTGSWALNPVVEAVTFKVVTV